MFTAALHHHNTHSHGAQQKSETAVTSEKEQKWQFVLDHSNWMSVEKSLKIEIIFFRSRELCITVIVAGIL